MLDISIQSRTAPDEFDLRFSHFSQAHQEISAIFHESDFWMTFSKSSSADERTHTITPRHTLGGDN